MIVSITPNPSIDISYFIDDFSVGKVHRVAKLNKVAGGKGINVAKVLNILGANVICSGFLGKNGSDFIKEGLNKFNIKNNFISVDGQTRSSLAINDPTIGTSTEIRENGPKVNDRDLNKFLSYINKLNDNTNIFSCSGSLPQGLDENFFDELLNATSGKQLVLDTSGQGLRHIVFESKLKPTAIKPNVDEIRDLFGNKIDSMSYKDILKLNQLKNIPIVIISLGKDGCVAKFYDKFYECKVPRINAINPVGSGDASLAGLCYGLENKLNPEECLKYSMACGVLNTLEEKIGFINIDKLQEMKNKVTVKELI